jgi:hypothetical protein
MNEMRRSDKKTPPDPPRRGGRRVNATSWVGPNKKPTKTGEADGRRFLILARKFQKQKTS